MACTGIVIEKDGKINRLKVITEVQKAGGMLIKWYPCDGEHIPWGDAEITVGNADNEENFHTTLRKEADAKGQLIRAQSTNPEWNPGYVELDDAVILEEE